MPSSERPGPLPMQRVAIVAPVSALRPVLVAVADAGIVDLDQDEGGSGTGGGAEPAASAAPQLLAEEEDLDRLRARGRTDLLAGEAQLQARSASAIRRGRVAGLLGWLPRAQLPRLAERLAPLGGAVVPLPRPRGVQPPTLLPPTRRTRTADPLVTTYATVPYADVDPTRLAVIAYVLMFGVMFADAGHGLLLVAAAVALRLGAFRRPDADRLAKVRAVWLYLAAAGAVAIVVGVAYGEFFGPTGVLPVAAVDPLEEPLLLLALAVGLGAVLLVAASVLAVVDRIREGGWPLALYSPTGVPGLVLLLALGAVTAGLLTGWTWLTATGVALGAVAAALAFAGLRAGAGTGGTGLVEAGVELVDLLVRLGSNVVSFARLAAFGMTHAALAAVVWLASAALWQSGGAARLGAVVVFVVGTAVTVGLEALVAAVQALRLEYYELFSRVFRGEGVPFRPWHVPTASTDEEVRR